MKRRQPRIVRPVTAEEKANYMRTVEEENPGYIRENEKLHAVVKILTGVRVLYAFFYMFVSWVYGLGLSQGLLILVSSIFFFVWYSFMIRSGKIVAYMLLFFRGIGIISGGAGLLSMILWLPFPLIFAMVFSLLMELAEAVFCIYVLFNKTASLTVHLNYEMDRNLLNPRVPAKQLEEAAEYINPYSGEEQETTAASQEEQKPQE